MSLVGPRPVLPELTAEFRFHYRLLLRARPGLTDPASLKYSQEARLLEQAPDPMRFFKTVVTPDKIRISQEYMERASIWTDVGTMAMTAMICCFPRTGKVYGELPDPAMELAPKLVNWLGPYAETSRSEQPTAAWPVVVGPSRLPVDGCVFSHELANLEASMEASIAASSTANSGANLEAMLAGEKAAVLDTALTATVKQPGRAQRLPWNRWHISVSRQQSTASEARESVPGL